MPVVLRIKGFRFFFYSEEGSEPIHIHVNKADASGKVWIEPIVEADHMYGFTVREEKEVMQIVNQNVELIKNKWNEFFGK